jgi:hypothetical protein
LDKEDNLVKIALTPTLVAIGWMSLLANVPALAQNAPVAQANPPATAPEATATATTATPAMNSVYGSNPVVNEATAMDNGLWDDTMVGPNCAVCGGGSGYPDEWYTIQGVRILSRNNLRKVPISFQAPAIPDIPGLNNSGFKAVPEPPTSPNAGSDHVINNDVTTATSTLNRSGTPIANQFQALNAKQLGLGIAPGYDMTIGHYFCRDKNNNDHFVEFSFWGLNSWSTSRTIDGYLVPIYDEDEVYTTAQGDSINNGTLIPLTPSQSSSPGPDYQVGSLRTPFPTPRELTTATDAQKTLSIAFNNGISQYFSYRSSINNFELNGRFTPRGQPDRMVMLPSGRWQRQCQPGTFMSYLYGLRFMQLNETFDFQTMGYGQFGSDWTTQPQHAVGDYGVVSYNNLLGLQVGADMTFRKCRWEWGFQSKLGPYLNFANQASTINASIVDGGGHDPYSLRLVKSRNVASMIGEVGVQASYKFRPNLIGRAGYDFMWVTGLALAPEQLQFIAEPVNRINTNGTVFSHGVKLGMEWTW